MTRVTQNLKLLHSRLIDRWRGAVGVAVAKDIVANWLQGLSMWEPGDETPSESLRGLLSRRRRHGFPGPELDQIEDRKSVV